MHSTTSSRSRPSRSRRRRSARAPISSGTPTGIYLIVPDAVNAPLVYRRLTQYEGWQERGEILEVWSDDFGYFYWAGESRKTYLPERP